MVIKNSKKDVFITTIYYKNIPSMFLQLKKHKKNMSLKYTIYHFLELLAAIILNSEGWIKIISITMKKDEATLNWG